MAAWRSGLSCQPGIKAPDPGWREISWGLMGELAFDSKVSRLAAAWGNEGQTGRLDSSHLTFSTWRVVRLLPKYQKLSHFGGSLW